MGFPSGSTVRNLPANAGDTENVCSIPGLQRFSGGRKGNPLQYSCLENPMDRGAWHATVHSVANSWTQLSDSACTYVGFQPPKFPFGHLNSQPDDTRKQGPWEMSTRPSWVGLVRTPLSLPPCEDMATEKMTVENITQTVKIITCETWVYGDL